MASASIQMGSNPDYRTTPPSFSAGLYVCRLLYDPFIPVSGDSYREEVHTRCSGRRKVRISAPRRILGVHRLHLRKF